MLPVVEKGAGTNSVGVHQILRHLAESTCVLQLNPEFFFSIREDATWLCAVSWSLYLAAPRVARHKLDELWTGISRMKQNSLLAQDSRPLLAWEERGHRAGNVHHLGDADDEYSRYACTSEDPRGEGYERISRLCKSYSQLISGFVSRKSSGGSTSQH